MLSLPSRGLFGPYPTATTIDVAKAALHASDPLVDSTGTNLSTFSADGGADKVAEWSRLFLVPGMAHCSGGPALDRFDMLSAVVSWVEKGIAPDSVIATGKAFPGRSRPLYAYPKHAQYTGNGDSGGARNFRCQ